MDSTSANTPPAVTSFPGPSPQAVSPPQRWAPPRMWLYKISGEQGQLMSDGSTVQAGEAYCQRGGAAISERLAFSPIKMGKTLKS